MKRFLWTVFKFSIWGLGFLGAYAVFSSSSLSQPEKWGVLLVLAGIALGYEINVIKEKLDTIQWALDDIRRGRD